ncbi:MAG: extracellular solute-binding protein [Deltaproteobacteria bacterium]|nr:extracellular solute-binding protein [Deltaproteobacteria bacterium]
MTIRKALVMLFLFLSFALFATGGQEGTTLNIMEIYTTMPKWNEYVAACEKALGIKLNIIAAPTETAARQQKITTMLSSKDPSIDIFNINDEMISAFKNAGWLQPLQHDVMTPDVVKNFAAKQYIKDMITSKNGDILTVPFDSVMLSFWVDEALLKSAGMKVPTNLDEFIAVAKATTRDGRWGYVGAWEKEYAYMEIATFVNLFGGNFLDWTNPANKKAIQFMYDLVNTWKVTPMALIADQYGQMSQRIIEGKAAMFFMWGYGDDYKAANRYGEDKVHIAPMPKFETRAAFIGAWHQCLSVASKNKQLGYKFLKYTANREGNLAAWQLLDRYPARLDAQADPSVLSLDAPLKKMYDYYSANVTLRARPMLPQTMEYITDIGSLFQQYVQNQITIDKFLDLAQQSVNKNK